MPADLARLQDVLAAFPPGLAYPMSELRYDPSRHFFDWPAIETALGSALPSDYKRLVDGYGHLALAGIFLVSPDDVPGEHAVQAEGIREFTTRPLFPEPGGLLLCATTEGRAVVWWDTADPDPDRWTIVWDTEYQEQTFDGTLTQLLVADLTGALDDGLTAFEVNEEKA
ncbi:hypothetical protein [Lentzea sp. NBRC 102530]|uniref:hypothetical protein n=1 Tax=Lentzea sp. NBRC 102530 TaxID=3032201 RepID=UPI0024A3E9D0|nr:hypothetical protein [Lentzea sp. NBRC 102530]GLY50101.1 hypothetical protein Lesp01_37570 [Lentzea sp. NBRC 102530]